MAGLDAHDGHRGGPACCPGSHDAGLPAWRLGRSYGNRGRDEAAKIALEEALGTEARPEDLPFGLDEGLDLGPGTQRRRAGRERPRPGDVELRREPRARHLPDRIKAVQPVSSPNPASRLTTATTKGSRSGRQSRFAERPCLRFRIVVRRGSCWWFWDVAAQLAGASACASISHSR